MTDEQIRSLWLSVYPQSEFAVPYEFARAMIAASGAPSGNGCDDCAGQGTYSDGLPCDTCKGAVSGAPAGAPKGEQQ